MAGLRAFPERDKVINVPIAKHHALTGTRCWSRLQTRLPSMRTSRKRSGISRLIRSQSSNRLKARTGKARVPETPYRSQDLLLHNRAAQH
jgi:hypothetical protein